MAFSAKDAGQRIRDRRMELHISLTKAAFDLGVSPDHLRRIERGERNLHSDFLFSVSEYLHVTASYIITGDSDRLRLSEELGEVIHTLEAIQSRI